MTRSRIATLTLALGATLAASAEAQGRKPQVAGIAPAPKPASTEPSVPHRGHHAAYLRGAVPVFVANDGQIYADFGYGYEPVIRNCAYASGSAYTPAAQAPVYAPPSYTPPAYTPPTYTPPTYTPPSYGQTTLSPRNTQPAPAQPTQSERDMAAMQAAQVAPAAQPPRPGAAACWRTDDQGRVIVLRP